MDVRIQFFSERLKRLLAGEEKMFRLNWDAAKELIQNLQTEVEFISSSLRYYEVDMALLLLDSLREHSGTVSALLALLKNINCFVNASEEAIDTFIMKNMQQNGESFSKELSDALLGLESKISDIKQHMQQVQPQYNVDFRLWIELFIRDALDLQRQRDTKSLQGDEMEELLDQLIEGPPQLSIVAIPDSCGIMMTTFVAEAYNSHYVKSYFDCYAWVSFDYSTGSILDRIMKIVMPQSALSEIMHLDFEKRRTELHNYLRNKRYLIVFDDLLATDVWDYLFRVVLPDHQNGSRVLSLFTSNNILTLCRMENGEMIDLDSVPVRVLRATYREWPFVLFSYGRVLITGIENSSTIIPQMILPILYIIELPFRLKLCCLYLSVFHERFEISTRQLYQLWIAEGFIPDNKEATAEEYLEQLIRRGIVGVKKKRAGGTIKTCCVPLITWVTLSAFAKALEFTDAMIQFVEIGNSKRLSIPGTVPDSISLEKTNTFLHSFLRLTSEINHRVSLKYCNEICKKFKFLILLDLGTTLLEDYPAGISNLVLLKYLKLNIPSLKHLPSSLCNLLNLLTLDMPSSYIEHTPDGIWKMNELRHLNFGFITLSAHPGNYSSSLENLIFISALHPSSCTQNILGRLPSLQSLQIHGNLSSYQPELSIGLSKLLCMESLKLVNESKIVPQLSTVVLPEYQFPPCLIELSLSYTELRDDPMPTLEKLPRLQVLKLKKNSYIGRKLACSSGGFPSLKVLHLKSMFWLEELTVESKAMPKLERLIINPCAYLKRLPEEIWHIKSFTKLEVWWPRYELRESLRKFEDKEKYHIQIYPYGM